MMSVFGFGRANVFKVVLVAAAAVLAACLLALVGMEKPAEAAFPGLNGKISFARDGDIYSMNADGSGQTNLTNTPFPSEEDANWSPDGTKIVFIRLGDIWVMNADGSGQANLTNTPSVGEQHPTYSPDGTKIALTSTVFADGISQIHVMNGDGSGRTSLTNTSANHYPAWSPDGTKIAFTSHRDGLTEIYSMNADGTNQTNLTNTAISVEHRPDWSPDGTKIVFDSDAPDDGSREIYSMNPDGTNQMQLTNAVNSRFSPAWSPDGTKIAFSTMLDNNNDFEIYSMNADGTNQTNLTNNPAALEVQPDWQPIVYNFGGFYQPVDNLPTLNKTKPGKTIPIRFSLGGDKGLNIFANESPNPKSEAIDCETGVPVDNIEQTELGKNGLTYDPVSDRYTYHWATNSSWSGCRQFVMKLKDGSVQRANFTFSK